MDTNTNIMIPKNIFQSWHTTDLHPDIQKQINKIKELNPEYTHKIYTDDEIDTFVNQYFPGEIAECYNRINIIVSKVDFWRYLILYKYGGVYLDMDSSIDKSLDDLIKPTDKAIITAEGNPHMFVQWALIFSKEHPILKRTIDMVVDNIKNNRYPNNIHKMTGPAVYSAAIQSVNTEIFRNPIPHHKITRYTDITLTLESISYRIYGIDYSGFLNFGYADNKLLYVNKKKWTEEQKCKSLLI